MKFVGPKLEQTFKKVSSTSAWLHSVVTERKLHLSKSLV